MIRTRGRSNGDGRVSAYAARFPDHDDPVRTRLYGNDTECANSASLTPKVVRTRGIEGNGEGLDLEGGPGQIQLKKCRWAGEYSCALVACRSTNPSWGWSTFPTLNGGKLWRGSRCHCKGCPGVRAPWRRGRLQSRHRNKLTTSGREVTAEPTSSVVTSRHSPCGLSPVDLSFLCSIIPAVPDDANLAAWGHR